jgi:hypothetical protein
MQTFDVFLLLILNLSLTNLNPAKNQTDTS